MASLQVERKGGTALRPALKPGEHGGKLAEKPPRQSRMVGEDDPLRS